MVDRVSLWLTPTNTNIGTFTSRFSLLFNTHQISKIQLVPINVTTNIFFSISQIFLYSLTQLFEPFISCLLIGLLKFSLVFLFDLQLCVLSFTCNHTLIYNIIIIIKAMNYHKSCLLQEAAKRTSFEWVDKGRRDYFFSVESLTFCRSGIVGYLFYFRILLLVLFQYFTLWFIFLFNFN